MTGFEKNAAAILEKLETIINDDNFVVKWNAMWKPLFSKNRSLIGNALTGNQYKGQNILSILLDCFLNGYNFTQYLTAKQIFKIAKENDTFVDLKGKKFTYIWYPIPVFKKDENGQKTDEISFFNYACKKMYNISQLKEILEFLPFVQKNEISEKTEIENKEIFEKITNIPKKPEIVFLEKNTPPCYYPSLHMVEMPAVCQWETQSAMLKTLAHEIGHATKKTVIRKYDYASEELFAETYAMLVCELFNIKTNTENSLAYIKSWFNEMKDQTDNGKCMKIFSKALNAVMEIYVNKDKEK